MSRNFDPNWSQLGRQMLSVSSIYLKFFTITIAGLLLLLLPDPHPWENVYPWTVGKCRKICVYQRLFI